MMVFTRVFRMVVLIGVVHTSNSALTPRDLERPERIVGGDPVQRGEMPWQVSLQERGEHFCGATLIGKNWAITAAHCTRGIKLRHVKAVVGGWDLRERNTVYKIKKMIVGAYETKTMTNDLALLKLAEKPKIRSSRADQKAIPIALDTRKDVADEECIVSGWGSLSEDGSSPNVLRAAMVTLRTDEECQKMVSSATSYNISNTNLCAGGGERDACQGDSGGPSWGIGCATRGVPGVYTEVGHYINWIHQHIEKEDGHVRQLVKFEEETNPLLVEIENVEEKEE